MMAGYWLSQAIYVAAKLGIADLLKDGPKGSGELAQAAGADPRSVYRLMRALASSSLGDVGGGHGTLIRAVLGASPKMRGILCDGPAVGEAGQKQIEAAGLSERCQTVAGDFFKSVPAGDAYTLKSVIHAWDDDRAAMILRNCRRAMAPEGKVLLIEMI